MLLRLAGLLLTTLSFTSAHAQDLSKEKAPARDVEVFETLPKRVKPGATVYVSDAASGEIEGRLIRVSPASVTVLVQGTEREFLKDDLRQVARRGDSVKNGALIGMGVVGAWAVIGALVTEDVETNDIDDPGVAMALVVYPMVFGMGAGIGALIDAATKGRTVVYRSEQRTISARPIILPGRVGVGFAMRF